MVGWLDRLLGRPGAVSFRRYLPAVADAADAERRMAALGDAGLLAAARGTESLAAIREAAKCTIGERPFDEQLLDGCAVEMDTGEGKTLAGALAAAGFALQGRRVHVLSVNDYLAKRDAEWMAPFYALLGITVAWVGQSSAQGQRRRAYLSDVLYAPVSEVGYDVLRDRFAMSNEE
ncbi:MAG: hypothetical protein QM607_12300 [Microbacterium sp.]